MLRSVGKFTLVFCAAAIITPTSLTAADNEALSLIEKSITFMGGAKNLKKYKGITMHTIVVIK